MKTRMMILMGEKQAKENRPINAAVIAKETQLTRQVIYKWINGEVHSFRDDMIEKLCNYFDCEIGDLLFIERPKN